MAAESCTRTAPDLLTSPPIIEPVEVLGAKPVEVSPHP